MARRLLPDEVWQLIEPLLPKHPSRPKGGRPLIDDRDVLTGILFMLKTGIAWEDLPSEMGCGCGMTCLRRLREWQQQDIWPRIQRILEIHLDDAKRIDWSRAEGRNFGTRVAVPGTSAAPPAPQVSSEAGTLESNVIPTTTHAEADTTPRLTASM